MRVLSPENQKRAAAKHQAEEQGGNSGSKASHHGGVVQVPLDGSRNPQAKGCVDAARRVGEGIIPDAPQDRPLWDCPEKVDVVLAMPR